MTKSFNRVLNSI